MKKFLQTLMSLLLIVTLASCGAGNNAPATDSGTTDNAATETAAGNKVVLLIEELGDMSFNDSANEGMQKAKEDFGIELDVVEYGYDPNTFQPNLIDAAENYDLVLVPGSMETVLAEVAPDFPDKRFVIFDSEVTGDHPNVYSITYGANEASYLGGYIAAALSESGTIGFLGGMDQPVINEFLIGYIEGAKAYNPDIKVAATYAGTYGDPSKGKELALGMINSGSDVNFNVAGGTGVGLIEAAADTNTYVIGVDADQAAMYEKQGQQNLADVIPTSVVKRVGDSLYSTIEQYINGELEFGSTHKLGLAENGVGIANNKYYQTMVPQEVIDKVDELVKQIQNGEIKVSTAMGMSTEEISQIRDGVRP